MNFVAFQQEGEGRNRKSWREGRRSSTYCCEGTFEVYRRLNGKFSKSFQFKLFKFAFGITP